MSNNQLPKVSIIIPTYNQERYIKQTIESCLMQDYSNLEIIVSDDCSKDNTEKIVKKIIATNNNVKYYKNEVNIGRVKNYHKALNKLATGDFFVNLDGDDYYIDSNFISDGIYLINNNRTFESEVLFYKALHTRNKYYKSSKGKTNINVIDNEIYLKHFSKYGFSHLSSIFNRDIAIKNNFYSQDLLSTDIESVLRLCATYKDKGLIIIEDKVVSVWNKHNENASDNGSWQDYYPSLEMYYRIKKLARSNGFTLPFLWEIKIIIKPLLHFIYTKTKRIVLSSQ